MKKRLFFGGLLIVICLVGIFTYRSFFVPTGNTIESREKILNESLSKGKEWSIAKEIKIEDYIISAASSTDHKVTLAVFQPTSNGGYQFSTSTDRNEDEIIIAGVNGAGKSTLYQTLDSLQAMERVNTDEIVRSFGNWRNSVDVLNAGKVAVSKIKEYFHYGVSFN